MLSVIIATSDSERALVPTLAALVPGATAGLVREVIVADANSRDKTEYVADVAGCVFLSSDDALGARLKAAAASARGTWLMFLKPGAVPGPNWIDETISFVEQSEHQPHMRAAVFAGSNDILALFGRILGSFPAEQGLIIRKLFYEALGGHRAQGDPHADLLRRIGRRNIVRLRTAVTIDI